ncbi:MAG: hypothetical protein WCP20_20115 [Desulfuromonadales bacterium]
MTQADKNLERMRVNPTDWRIEDIQAIARRYGIEWRHDGGSHCVFVAASGRTLPVPARKPIKPLYIKKFLLLLEEP